MKIIKTFVAALLGAKLVHNSFIHALSVINYPGFAGLPIFDQLLQPDDADFLPEYLAMIDGPDLRGFVNFSLQLIDKTPRQVRDELRKTPVYPDNYAENENIALLSTPRIANLVVEVCEKKDIPNMAQAQRFGLGQGKG